jgi:hypothetical protein
VSHRPIIIFPFFGKRVQIGSSTSEEEMKINAHEDATWEEKNQYLMMIVLQPMLHKTDPKTIENK